MKRLFVLVAMLLNSSIFVFADDTIQQKRDADLFYQEYACPAETDSSLKSKEEEERIQHLAVTTVANMAQGIVSIGNHPDDPQVVAQQVAGIVANFTNFVMQAMKNANAVQLLQDEQFCKCVAARIRSMKKGESHRSR